ncbi:MAG: hypothetical protein ACI8UP_005598, partial [Porticoccaceae bacterium]
NCSLIGNSDIYATEDKACMSVKANGFDWLYRAHICVRKIRVHVTRSS